MEENKRNESLIIQLLNPFISKMNELNQEFTVWLAIDEDSTKQSFVDINDDNLHFAEQLLEKYGEIIDFNGIEPKIVCELIVASGEFGKKLGSAIKAAKDLINYYYKLGKERPVEKDLGTVGKYLKNSQDTYNEIKKYLPELNNLVKQDI